MNRCLEAVDLARGTWYYRQSEAYQRSDPDDEKLKEHIVDIITEHPGYGRRRILPELEERTGETINHKRLRRLLNDHELGLKRCLPTGKASPLREVLADGSGQLDLVSGRDFGALEVLSTDFTQLRFDGGSRVAWLMAMVDISSCWAPGWAVGSSADHKLALRCWERTRASLSRSGVDVSGLIVHSDLDSVYTSYDWCRQLLVEDEVRLSYSERGAKDNPWIESLWGRLKTEIRSKITEASTLTELKEVIATRFDYYNHRRRHSSLDNRPPVEALNTQFEQFDIAPVS